MSEYAYAMFDENGRCTNIVQTVIELDMPHSVIPGTKPEDIYLSDGEINVRKQITIAVDREHYVCDGIDQPIIIGLPDDAVLLSNNVLNGSRGSKLPGVVMFETTGEYRSNMVSVMFAPLEDIASVFAAKVDQAAGVARGQIMTTIPGQQIIYAKKEAEALAWLNREPGEYAFLTAEAGEGSMDDLATAILARVRATEAALASIEALRMGAKQAISNATDAAAIIAAADITWP